MTNEELVECIKTGEENLIPVLWGKVEKWVNIKAKDWYEKYLKRCSHAGVNIDDLKQVAYFAFLDAVKYYDPEKEYSFITYMRYPLMNHFGLLCGFNAGKKHLLNDAISLNMPTGEDDITLEDAIEDETAVMEFQSIERSYYIKQLHDDLEKCLSNISGLYADVIRARYWENMSFKDIAIKIGKTEKVCRARETEGLRQLRTGKNRMLLNPYMDEILTGNW